MQGDGKIISNTHPSLARIFTAITFALLATPKRSPTAVALCVVMIYIERDVVSLGYSPRKDHLRNVCSVTVAILLLTINETGTKRCTSTELLL